MKCSNCNRNMFLFYYSLGTEVFCKNCFKEMGIINIEEYKTNLFQYRMKKGGSKNA